LSIEDNRIAWNVSGLSALAAGQIDQSLLNAYRISNRHILGAMTTKEKLNKIKKKWYELERVRKHLEGLHKEYAKEEKLLKKRERKMKKEFEEYDAMEGKSIKGFFYSVLGSKEDQIEKERQEYIQASLEYEESRKAIDMLSYEIEVLESKASKLSQIEAEYKVLIKKREKELLKDPSGAGHTLRKIVEQRRFNEQVQHEIKQAEKAGVRSLELLQQMIRHLQAARNWGNWDMYGKGRMASYNKQGAVDRAKESAYRVRHQLNIYQKELADIYGNRQQFNFNFNIESINSFTDIFFDNLITDWIIQQKINNSLNSVKTIHDKVLRIQQNLAQEYQTIKKENRQLDSDYKRTIEESA